MHGQPTTSQILNGQQLEIKGSLAQADQGKHPLKLIISYAALIPSNCGVKDNETWERLANEGAKMLQGGFQ